MKKNKRKKIKTLNEIEKDSFFYEELLLFRLQEVIAKALVETGMRKVDLAKKIGKSKSDVTQMLSSGRNLTIRSFAKVLFHMNRELIPEAKPIRKKR